MLSNNYTINYSCRSLKTAAGVLVFFSVFLCNDSAKRPVLPPPGSGDSGGFWGDDINRKDSVTANHKPFLKQKCDYRMYVDFNKIVADNVHSPSRAPYNKAVGKEYFDHPYATPTRPKIMNPRDLCIATDEKKNIDVNEFDCLPDILDTALVYGYCGCGRRWSQIDLNDKSTYLGLNKKSHSYEYLSLLGLDKFLAIQKADTGGFECVAERFGHCTLQENKDKVTHFTKCRKGYKCRNISIWKPVQRFPIININTEEWYGLCIPQNTEDVVRDPYSFSVRRLPSVTVIITALLIIALLTNARLVNSGILITIMSIRLMTKEIIIKST